ncbi:flagellin lysine-N-methylase [Aeromonas bivalvium]|uniref:Flagellin lysine-N-methylase n=1 Tax=Aeromonas bivalvium TaxID=440079 RepID=A0ABW9GRL8_9GAMM
MAHTLLTPRYYQQFQCIGDRCEDNCCHGWTISIDKQTYRHYVSHPDQLIQSTAKQHIQKVKKSNDHWGTIRMNEAGACPFLDGVGLCNVHKQAGPEALSQTCKSYPRLQSQFGEQHRRSLVLSCPEVSRRVLLDPQAMAMEATPFTGKGKPRAVPPALASLHMLSIDVLLADAMTVEERLWLIGMLIHRDESQVSNQTFLAQMVPMIEQGQLATAFAQLPFIGKIQWWALRTLTHLLMLNNQNQQRRGRATMTRCLETINRVLEGEFDEAKLASLHQCWHERVAPFLAERPHIQQNHLLYYVYHNQFPAKEQSPQLAYRLLIADYFLLRSYLCLLAMGDAPLTEGDVTDLFYSYHTVRQHNASFLSTLEQGLEASGLASDLTLYALLKTG